MKAPGDESGKAAGFFLEAADVFQVVDPVIDGFSGAEHHGGGGADAELVGCAVDIQPFFGIAFEAGDSVADFVVKDLCTGTGDRLETGVAKPGECVANGDAGDGSDVEDLWGGKKMEPDAIAKFIFNGTAEGLVPFDFEFGMEAALHQYAGTAEVDGFLNFFEDRFVREDVTFRGIHRTVEVAEGAIFCTEVGVVDIAIDDVADDAVWVKVFTDRISGHSERDEVVGMKKVQGLLTVDTGEAAHSGCLSSILIASSI